MYKHKPRKSQSKLMRHWRAKYGMAREEVREQAGDLKYWIPAHDHTPSETGIKSQARDRLKHLVKHVLCDLKLPLEHPEILREVNTRLGFSLFAILSRPAPDQNAWVRWKDNRSLPDHPVSVADLRWARSSPNNSRFVDRKLKIKCL